MGRPDVAHEKNGRSGKSGQVQGGNAQEGQRQRREEVRDTAMQQYAKSLVSRQAEIGRSSGKISQRNPKLLLNKRALSLCLTQQQNRYCDAQFL